MNLPYGDRAELETEHGTKHRLAGIVETPNGQRIRVQTIWIIDQGQSRPRFVTAYPA